MTDGPITLGELSAWPVTRLAGVGERKAEGLAVVGVETLADLLTYYPRRYVDRTNECRIRDLVVGEEAMVLVTVVRTSSRRTRGRPPKVLVTAEVRDDSGTLRVTFFNQAWRERQLAKGDGPVGHPAGATRRRTGRGRAAALRGGPRARRPDGARPATR